MTCIHYIILFCIHFIKTHVKKYVLLGCYIIQSGNRNCTFLAHFSWLQAINFLNTTLTVDSTLIKKIIQIL